jgi:hypothetical protein
MHIRPPSFTDTILRREVVSLLRPYSVAAVRPLCWGPASRSFSWVGSVWQNHDHDGDPRLRDLDLDREIANDFARLRDNYGMQNHYAAQPKKTINREGYLLDPLPCPELND